MNENKHTVYTAADIQQYLDGKLTPMQMYAIEKAALDDDFLAEAIEGYAQNKDSNWQQYLQQAKANFTVKKEEETKVVAMAAPNKKIWFRAAAAIFVLAGLAVAYNLLNKPNPIDEPKEIAKVNTLPQQNAVEDTTTQATDTKAKVEQQKTDKKSGTTTIIATTPIDTKENISRDMAANDDVAGKLEEGKKDKAVEVVTTAVPAAPIVTPASKEVAAVADKQANSNVGLGYTKTEAKAAPSTKTYQFISQVVAPDNTPLPFANISIKSENFGTYTDVKGNFRINSPDSILTVVVKSVGYLPKYYTLNAKTNLNKIILAEDRIAASNEVVIKKSNTNITSRKATFLKDTIINVEPADGWENYGTYVSNNFDIPDDILKDKNRHGEVEVTFNVTASGAITDIKIDKSACNRCDEEAMKKAIQQGPQWKLMQGKSGKAKIKVQF
jgi:TonB family protein